MCRVPCFKSQHHDQTSGEVGPWFWLIFQKQRGLFRRETACVCLFDIEPSETQIFQDFLPSVKDAGRDHKNGEPVFHGCNLNVKMYEYWWHRAV